MANIEYHGLLKSVDENDNVKTLYPKTYVSDIIMSGGGSLEDTLSNKQNSTDNSLATTSKTVVGAINELNTNLSNKQDKLTNPLTKSDVVDNLSSTSTTTPLSANQGRVLNNTLSKKLTVDTWWPAGNTTTSSDTYDGVYSTNSGDIPSDLKYDLETYYKDYTDYGTVALVKTPEYNTGVYVDVWGNIYYKFSNTSYSVNGRTWNRLTTHEILPLLVTGGKTASVYVSGSYYYNYIPSSEYAAGDVVLMSFGDGTTFIGLVNSSKTGYEWYKRLSYVSPTWGEGSDYAGKAGKNAFYTVSGGLGISCTTNNRTIAKYCIVGKTSIYSSEQFVIGVDNSSVQSVYDTNNKKLTFTVPAGVYIVQLHSRTYNVTSGTYPEKLQATIDGTSGDPFISWTSPAQYDWGTCSSILVLTSGTHNIYVFRSTKGGSFNLRGAIIRVR